MLLDPLQESGVAQEGGQGIGQAGIIVRQEPVNAIGDEVADPAGAGAQGDYGQAGRPRLQDADAEGFHGRGMQVDVRPGEGPRQLIALDPAHQGDAIGRAAGGRLLGEAGPQGAVPVHVQLRLPVPAACDGRGEDAHHLEGPLELDPAQ